MILSLPSPPRLPAHTWRPLRSEDGPALFKLEADCAPIDGGTSMATIAGHETKLEQSGDNLRTDTLCAVDSTGRFAAGACEHSASATRSGQMVTALAASRGSLLQVQGVGADAEGLSNGKGTVSQSTG